MDFAVMQKQGEKEYMSDCIAAIEDGSCFCFAVADGRDNSRAAETAVKIVSENFGNIGEITKETIPLCFDRIDEAFRDDEDPLKACMAVLLTDGSIAVWGHIGDCRIYLLRDNLLYEITADHSGAYALYEAGEIRYPKIRKQRTRYELTRMLGNNPKSDGEFSAPELIRKGDSLLLCTDGFWENIHERKIEKTLKKSKSAQDWLSRMMKIAEKNIKKKKYTGFKDSMAAITIKM